MLTEFLQAELVVITELQELLQQEYAALKARDLAGLQRLAAAKQRCADRLQTLTERHLEFSPLWPGESGNAAAPQSHPGEPAAHRQLETLRKTLAEGLSQVQRQNEINGAITAASRNHVERAWAILCGRDPQACLYSQGAQMSFASSCRTLGKA
jgi:flagellar biosynthesis/type III secretory pathway chaperone